MSVKYFVFSSLLLLAACGDSGPTVCIPSYAGPVCSQQSNSKESSESEEQSASRPRHEIQRDIDRVRREFDELFEESQQRQLTEYEQRELERLGVERAQLERELANLPSN